MAKKKRVMFGFAYDAKHGTPEISDGKVIHKVLSSLRSESLYGSFDAARAAAITLLNARRAALATTLRELEKTYTVLIRQQEEDLGGEDNEK
jgi:hypothetical protein